MNDLVEVLRSKSAHDPALRALLKSIDSGKANFRDTAQYSIRYSHQLGNILSENVLDIPPDVRETAAEELLKYGYDDMNTWIVNPKLYKNYLAGCEFLNCTGER